MATNKKSGREGKPSLLDRIREWGGNNPLIVIIIICGIVIAFISQVSGNVDAIFKFFKEETLLTIDVTPRQIHVTDTFSPIDVEVEITLITNEIIQIGDAKIALTIFQNGNTIIPLTMQSEYFSVKTDRFDVPVLSREQNQRRISFQITPLKSGKYTVQVALLSEKYRGLPSKRFDLLVDLYPFEKIKKLAPSVSPVFIARNGKAETSPYFVSELKEFKVVIAEEALLANLAKATVWFRPAYVGALGGATYQLYRDSSGRLDAWGHGKDEGIVPYQHQLQTTLDKAQSLVEEGFLGDTVPIGTAFYAIDIVGDHTIVLSKMRVNCTRREMYYYDSGKGFSGNIFNDPDDPVEFDNPIRLKTINPDISFELFPYSCGATGRNCVVSLEINDKEYVHYYEAESQADIIINDFPVWVNSGGPGILKFDLNHTQGILEIYSCGN